ncbi:hypothetical protein ACH5RR_032441 [Cinchona calisaya]|uniref:Uncharacterized protein n=1 Tax=Cinchona calisaya TaxID=153742 RepID=A0ABD2YI23_9GENT
MRAGGQTELQAEGYTAVEDSILHLLRELMQDRLILEPIPSQWDRVIELLHSEDERADPNIIYEKSGNEASSSDKDVSGATLPTRIFLL